MFFAMGLAVASANAGQYVLGMNFVVSHPTTISEIGVNDGGAALASTETVGIFDDLTGSLVGSEVVFGPGEGTQVGNTDFESVTPFELFPGDYSVITISAGGLLPGQGGGLTGGNSYQNLGGDVDLPGGNRFNSGTGLDVLPGEGSGYGNPVALVDPPAPDGGLTAMLLGVSLAGLGWARRKF